MECYFVLVTFNKIIAMETFITFLIIITCVLIPLGLVLLYESRIKDGPGKETRQAWHNDPSNWKAWGFYFNKSDPRIFPPKRSYLGWTINFANPYSILAMILLFLLLLTANLYLVPMFLDAYRAGGYSIQASGIE
jgi:uncharacterized membrane protein